MYLLVYKAMEEDRLAFPFPFLVLMNKQGNIVHLPDDGYGLPVDLKVRDPSYVIFSNEGGNNTNMKCDNQIGGEKKMIAKG